jgi:hypothetical protein
VALVWVKGNVVTAAAAADMNGSGRNLYPEAMFGSVPWGLYKNIVIVDPAPHEEMARAARDGIDDTRRNLNCACYAVVWTDQEGRNILRLNIRKIKVLRNVAIKSLNAYVSSCVSGWGFPSILNADVEDIISAATSGGPNVNPFDKNVSAQLLLGGFVGTFDQFFGGSPEQPSRYAEDDCEKRNYGLGVLVNELTSAVDTDFKRCQELGDTFWKSLAGFVVIVLAYAGLKRL